MKTLSQLANWMRGSDLRFTDRELTGVLDFCRDGIEPENPTASRGEGRDLEQVTDGKAESPVEQPTGRAIPWGKQALALHPDFIEGLFWIETKIGLKPEWLTACMKFESNLNPKARNPNSSASGLIQFMSATAQNLGTNIAAIREMGPMEQLGYVYKYFQQIRDDWTGLGIEDVYMAILWPVAVGKPNDYSIFVDGSSVYQVNRGLDINKNGIVTKDEAASKVRTLYYEGLKDGNVIFVHKQKP